MDTAAADDDDVVESILTLLSEAIDGPPENGWSWVVTNSADAGLLPTVAKLSAADASRRIPGHVHTIAGHVNHVRFALNAAVRWLTEPQPPDLDWDASWAVQEVDDAAWRDIRNQVAHEHARLREALRGEPLAGMNLTGSIGAPAHVAYHLGAIRQLIAAIRHDEH